MRSDGVIGCLLDLCQLSSLMLDAGLRILQNIHCLNKYQQGFPTDQALGFGVLLVFVGVL